MKLGGVFDPSNLKPRQNCLPRTRHYLVFHSVWDVSLLSPTAYQPLDDFIVCPTLCIVFEQSHSRPSSTRAARATDQQCDDCVVNVGRRRTVASSMNTSFIFVLPARPSLIHSIARISTRSIASLSASLALDPSVRNSRWYAPISAGRS